MIVAFVAALFAAPCQLDEVKAECSTLRVPENRGISGGRELELHYAVVAASPGKRSADAIFVLAGGPGQAATSLAGYVAQRFAGSERDIVLVDARGTGSSNALHCDFGGSDDDLAGYFNDMLPADRVARCKEALAARADLTQYTTKNIVEDVEAVRKRLGYATINLFGTSYGTRTAQEMMRRYPKTVRMAILDGVVPPSLATPSTFARDAQRSLDAVLAMCRADQACHAAFPELDREYRAVLEAAAGGLELQVEHPETKKRAKVKITRGFFGEILRNFLYSPDRYVRLPLTVHSAARGDWSVYAELAVLYATGVRTLDFGQFLSVTCTEDLPRVDVAAAKAEAAGTMLGSYRIEQQTTACSRWSRGQADPAASTPLTSSIPTLLISRGLDPVTPARFAEEVARTLPNSVRVVVPSGAHSGDTGGCLEKICVAAVRAGSVKALDRSCVEKVKPPAFMLRR